MHTDVLMPAGARATGSCGERGSGGRRQESGRFGFARAPPGTVRANHLSGGCPSLLSFFSLLFSLFSSHQYFLYCNVRTPLLQVSSEPHVWQSYAALLAHELRVADAGVASEAAAALKPIAERVIDYCQRAVRLHLNAANWEADGARRAELLAALAALLEAHLLAGVSRLV